jgi:eukaryotic translation initiation factor 2C
VLLFVSRYARLLCSADADLACERGRCYIHGLLNADSGSVSGRSLSSAAEEAVVFEKARKLWGSGPHAYIKDKMYYI